VGFYEGNYVSRDGGALACLVVEVDQDYYAAGEEVGGGGIAQLVFEGPGFGAYAGGASVDVDGGGIEDGFEEVDFGAGYCEVEGVGVGQAGDVGVVGYASGLDVCQVGRIIDMIEHITIRKSHGFCVAEAPFLTGLIFVVHGCEFIEADLLIRVTSMGMGGRCLGCWEKEMCKAVSLFTRMSTHVDVAEADFDGVDEAPFLIDRISIHVFQLGCMGLAGLSY
jgi:hypothetical protein